jgi:hypothetical protein
MRQDVTAAINCGESFELSCASSNELLSGQQTLA